MYVEIHSMVCRDKSSKIADVIVVMTPVCERGSQIWWDRLHQSKFSIVNFWFSYFKQNDQMRSHG